MSSDGMFQKIYKTVCRQPSVVDTKNAWAELDNNYSRVEYLISNPELEALLSVRANRSNKNLSKAKSLKDEGNKYFQKKNHAAALSAYNKALLLTPFRDNEGLLSVCYANRSAVLFHIKKYADCLNDITRAIEAGYSKELLYKLLIRKAKCHQFIDLHRMGDAVLTARESLNFSNLDDAGKTLWHKELLKVTRKNVVKEETQTIGQPTCLEKANTKYPALNHTVKVSENNEFGRYIQATADISTGEIILKERPYCSVTSPDYYLTHCCHCQVRADLTPLPCTECADVVYCSSQCQEAAWNAYHRYECCHMKNLKDINVNMGHLALRTALQAGLSTLLSIIQGGVTPSDTSYLSRDYNKVFLLEGHEDDRSTSDLFWRAVASALLAGMCDLDEWGKGNEKARTVLAAITLHHMQVFPCNAHEIASLLYDIQVPYQSKLLEIGDGIYPTLSFFNHSCDPTVVRSFTNGNTCVMKSLCPISRNEQLFDNYGCLYAVHALSERRTKLSQYYFECCCEPCLQDWGLYTTLSYNAEPIYKCLACSSLVVSQECQNCDTKFDKGATNQTLMLAKSAFDQVLSRLFSEHIQGEELTTTLNKLVSYSNLVNKLVFRPYRTLNDCQEALKHVYNMYGNLSIKYN